MKVLFILLVAVAAGLYAYPTWHEQTATACQALDKRTAEIANAGMRSSSPYGVSQDSSSAVMYDASGGVSAAAVASSLPAMPRALGCVVSYWRVPLSPNLGQMIENGS